MFEASLPSIFPLSAISFGPKTSGKSPCFSPSRMPLPSGVNGIFRHSTFVFQFIHFEVAFLLPKAPSLRGTKQSHHQTTQSSHTPTLRGMKQSRHKIHTIFSHRVIARHEPISLKTTQEKLSAMHHQPYKTYRF